MKLRLWLFVVATTACCSVGTGDTGGVDELGDEGAWRRLLKLEELLGGAIQTISKLQAEKAQDKAAGAALATRVAVLEEEKAQDKAASAALATRVAVLEVEKIGGLADAVASQSKTIRSLTAWRAELKAGCEGCAPFPAGPHFDPRIETLSDDDMPPAPSRGREEQRRTTGADGDEAESLYPGVAVTASDDNKRMIIHGSFEIRGSLYVGGRVYVQNSTRVHSAPTLAPTESPAPTSTPSAEPTIVPTDSQMPTALPTLKPTQNPTFDTNKWTMRPETGVYYSFGPDDSPELMSWSACKNQCESVGASMLCKCTICNAL